jgi:hypothetical protein
MLFTQKKYAIFHTIRLDFVFQNAFLRAVSDYVVSDVGTTALIKGINGAINSFFLGQSCYRNQVDEAIVIRIRLFFGRFGNAQIKEIAKGGCFFRIDPRSLKKTRFDRIGAAGDLIKFGVGGIV